MIELPGFIFWSLYAGTVAHFAGLASLGILAIVGVVDGVNYIIKHR